MKKPKCHCRWVEQDIRDVLGPHVTSITWNPNGEEMRLLCPTSHDAVHAFISLKTRSHVGPASMVSTRLGALPDVLCVDFDLSFRAFGLRNSYLLQKYMSAHPCVRPGAQVLKDWSKATGLNNSSEGWLCTYAMNVMWLHFLMHKRIHPFVLPGTRAGVLQHVCGLLLPE